MMKKLPIISVLVLLWIISGHVALSQDSEKEHSKTIKKEVKVTIDDESSDPKYTIETTTTENGEKKIVKKTYSSLEEMKADSSMEVINTADKNGNITMKLGDKGSGVMVFTSDEGDTFDIKIDEITEDMEWVETSEEDGHKVIKIFDGRMMYFNEDEGESGNSFSFITEDGDSNHMVKRYVVKVIKDGDHADHKIHEHKNVFVIKDEDGNVSMSEGGDTDVMVWVDDDGNKTIKRSFHKKIDKASFSKAKIETIAASDTEFSSFNLAGMPELVLKSINYYPNPNEGEFTLAFSGSKKPVIVRILDLKGNMKMEENIKNFDGTFNQVLNVKHFNKGAYLLQIFQQNKVLNRKLILE